jgi:hypothetical protein
MRLLSAEEAKAWVDVRRFGYLPILPADDEPRATRFAST